MPNVATWQIRNQLFFRGDFEYQETGHSGSDASTFFYLEHTAQARREPRLDSGRYHGRAGRSRFGMGLLRDAPKDVRAFLTQSVRDWEQPAGWRTPLWVGVRAAHLENAGQTLADKMLSPLAERLCRSHRAHARVAQRLSRRRFLGLRPRNDFQGIEDPSAIEEEQRRRVDRQQQSGRQDEMESHRRPGRRGQTEPPGTRPPQRAPATTSYARGERAE